MSGLEAGSTLGGYEILARLRAGGWACSISRVASAQPAATKVLAACKQMGDLACAGAVKTKYP